MTEAIDPEDMKALDAIRTLVEYLGKSWISEGCRTYPQMGCASCEAVELERKLQMLAAEIRQNADIPIHS